MKFFFNKLTLIIIITLGLETLQAQDTMKLNLRHRQIAKISALTATGQLTTLNKALHAALDSGLAINEINEVLVHLYAYTGFPRSLQGINTHLAVVNDRKAKGIIDKTGKTTSPVRDNLSRYQRGKKVLETLTGVKETGPKTGYAVFVPEVEVFLKEHLFNDLFTRDIISYTDREIATVSALIALGKGVEPMMQSHMKITMNLGIKPVQMNHLISIVENELGSYHVEAAKSFLSKSSTGLEAKAATTSVMNFFNRGVRAPVERFTGIVWLNGVIQAGDSLGYTLGVVTFEPGARSDWHYHPGGQLLLVTNGKGYYQEKGSPIKVIYKGDVVKCAANILHWHGASTNSEMSHTAISGNLDKGSVVWKEKVSDLEYLNNSKLER